MLLQILFSHFLLWANPALVPVTDFTFEKYDIEDMNRHLQKASLPLEQWISEINQSSFDLLCFGESHSEFFRTTYGQIFSQLEFSTLFIEAVPSELDKILVHATQKKSTKLLDAPFDPILKAVTQKAATLYAVDSTPEQDALQTQVALQTGKRHLSRDGFIATNILNKMQSHKKHIALYGRAHCSLNNTNLGSVPFFNFIKNYDSKKIIENVMILRRTPEPHVHPLVSLLDYGLETSTKPILVLDAQKISPKEYNYHWEIKTLLENFRYIVVI